MRVDLSDFGYEMIIGGRLLISLDFYIYVYGQTHLR